MEEDVALTVLILVPVRHERQKHGTKILATGHSNRSDIPSLWKSHLHEAGTGLRSGNGQISVCPVFGCDVFPGYTHYTIVSGREWYITNHLFDYNAIKNFNDVVIKSGRIRQSFCRVAVGIPETLQNFAFPAVNGIGKFHSFLLFPEKAKYIEHENWFSHYTILRLRPRIR